MMSELVDVYSQSRVGMFQHGLTSVKHIVYPVLSLF